MKTTLTITLCALLMGCTPSSSSMKERIRLESGADDVVLAPYYNNSINFIIRKDDGSVWWADGNTKEPIELKLVFPPMKP